MYDLDSCCKINIYINSFWRKLYWKLYLFLYVCRIYRVYYFHTVLHCTLKLKKNGYTLFYNLTTLNLIIFTWCVSLKLTAQEKILHQWYCNCISWHIFPSRLLMIHFMFRGTAADFIKFKAIHRTWYKGRPRCD